MKHYCLVRFDDVCPTMDYEQFDRAFKLMDEYNIKPLLGVIPSNKDQEQMIDKEDKDFWDYLKKLQAKGYELAMHGLNHTYTKDDAKTMVCGHKHSEFAGYPLEKQTEMIAEGKRTLESHGIYTDVFFAPGHSYDRNTLKALAKNGFKYLSDGLSSKAYKECGIICVPCRSQGVPRKLRGKICMATNHPSEWRRIDKQKEYEYLKDFCEKYKDNIVSFAEVKKMKPGCFIIQKINEKMYKALYSFIHKIRKY